MNKSPASAASATYRKAVNSIAGALDQEPTHSRYPSFDLEVAIGEIPEAIKQKAIEWYVRGIKRGMAKATDLMVEGEIYVENNTVYAPKKIKIKVRIKMAGGEWERQEVIISSEEIGFE